MFRSNGAFADFVGFWLNGEKLVEGVDYDVSEGSTRITIRSQTFEDKANQEESNTIAAEFRTGGGDPNGTHEGDLKRTAQNFTIDTTKQPVSEVDDVIALIDAIPSPVTLNDKATVENARAAYDKLPSAQKQAVTNYSKLQAAEAVIAALEEDGREDREAASKVIALIDAIPMPVTLGSRDAINAARSAYNMLTVTQKGYVTNYSKLTAAEVAIADLELANNQNYQSVIFVGCVVDKSGNPMPDMIVEIHSTVQTARTDSNGYFRFSGVEMGSHSITVSDANGKVIASKDFSIVAGSPMGLAGNTITAENGAVLSVTIQVEQNSLAFLSVQEGDRTASGSGSNPSSNTDIDEASPQTGDNTNLLLWYTLLVLSLSGLVVLLPYNWKKSRV